MECPVCDRTMHFSVGTVQSVRCDSCLERVKCTIQSEEYTLAPEVGAMAQVESETTSFMDAAAGVKVGMSVPETDLDTADAVTSAGLKDFLSRPVRIANFTWSTSDPVGAITSFSPWFSFFNNANIKYKLNNFAFLRATLKLKFLINASPFYYGSMRACYQPLPSFKGGTIRNATIGSFTNTEFIPFSQQPGVWLKPQHSEGAELTLPFFYPRSFLKAQVAQDFADMGIVQMVIYNILRSANGVTGPGATVQVYAWAEDVVLAGPSVGLSMQADEYGVGVVSGPASTVASIAGKLRSVPVLGKFATATEIGAKAIAGIAKLFGFTNVPVIADTVPYRPTPFPQLASPEIGYPVEKLTLDSKNELSIDPSILGMDNKDELAIQNFATRQSFLCSASWTTASAVDTPLFTSLVSPSMGLGIPVAGEIIQMTPLGLVAQMFKSWRGDIIFTFRFVASPFHKGRVRISYDPYNSSVQTTADTGPTTFNKVVDLGSETEVDVRIPYQQALAWCYTQQFYNPPKFSTSATPTLTYTDTFDNGILSVKVLTLLTAPVATSTVEMQVFVRGAENIEFGNPQMVAQGYSPFIVQSEEYSEKREGETLNMGSSDSSIDVHRSRLFFGENVRSLRVLLRRSNFIDAIVPTATTSDLGYWRLTQTRFPPYWGYDLSGKNQAKGLNVPASNFFFNYTDYTPWHFIANCFVAQRGSMHWHYNWAGPKETSLRVSRNTDTITGTTEGYVTQASGSRNVNTYFLRNNTTVASAGVALTNQLTSAGMSISAPNYSVFKFESTDPRNSTLPVSSGGRYDGSVYEGINVDILTNGTTTDIGGGRLERYAAIGTDYSLYFFLNCPSLIYYNNVVPT